MNTSVPQVRIQDVGGQPDDSTLPDQTDKPCYGRKRSYSISRLSGVGERSRRTEGVKVLWETGGVAVEVDEKDYGVV